MKRITQLFPMLTVMVFAGCHDQSTAPRVSEQRAQPSIDGSRRFVTCPARPTFTVSDEASLRAAVAAARPGAVIAIRGMIGLAAELVITTANVTLTCAAPGAGLFSLSTNVGFLVVVDVGGSGAVVDGLALDASGTVPVPAGLLIGGAYFAGNISGIGAAVTNVRFSNNTVTCGPGNCAAFVGTPGAMILNNTFTQSFQAPTGVHIQLGVVDLQNVRVQGNIVTATAPGTVPIFGGIRVVGGSDVIVADNVITGPWVNSISVMSLTQSLITNNRVSGAASDGIRLGNRLAAPIDAVHGNVVSNNRATAAGEAGISVNLACNNVFVGNRLQGNAGDVGAIFAVNTGANTFLGNGTLVIDDGALDCNGDGVIDPNFIFGRFRHSLPGERRATTLTGVVSDSVRPATGTRIALE